MRGRVLGWDNTVSQGQISGEDGARYIFNRADWRESVWPQRGQLVDFENNATQATNIYVLQAVASPSAPGQKDKVVAALLAFFLGWAGAHKFYLGRTTPGLIMLLVWIFGWILFGLPSFVIWVISMVEFVIYLVTDEAEFQRKYVQGEQGWF